MLHIKSVSTKAKSRKVNSTEEPKDVFFNTAKSTNFHDAEILCSITSQCSQSIATPGQNTTQSSQSTTTSSQSIITQSGQSTTKSSQNITQSSQSITQSGQSTTKSSQKTTKSGQSTTHSSPSTARIARRQMSIDKCVLDCSLPEQEVHTFLRKSDLESIASLIAENVVDYLGGGKKPSTTSVETGNLGQAPGSKASNLYELLVQEKVLQLI